MTPALGPLGSRSDFPPCPSPLIKSVSWQCGETGKKVWKACFEGAESISRTSPRFLSQVAPPTAHQTKHASKFAKAGKRPNFLRLRDICRISRVGNTTQEGPAVGLSGPGHIFYSGNREGDEREGSNSPGPFLVGI